MTLSVNVDKTKFTVFCCRGRVVLADVRLMNHGIEFIETTRFLGVMLDNNF